MEFSPSNSIVRLCLQGIHAEETGALQEAREILHRAWREATQEHQKFITSYIFARLQVETKDKLKWYETALNLANRMNSSAVRSAFPFLYSSISKFYLDLGNPQQSEHYFQLESSFDSTPSDPGPFFHGTKADLRVGDFLNPGQESNYQTDLKMNHIYFTALVQGAGLAAELAKGESAPRVYVVEPTGDFEDDPNVTNKKFPGNPTRSYRSLASLRIIGEETNWTRQTPEQIQYWRDRIVANQGKIINE